EKKFTNGISSEFNYRAPLGESSKSYELTGLSAPTNYYSLQTILSAAGSAAFIDYEVQPSAGIQKRLIEFVRYQYRANNGSSALPFGSIESKGLIHQSFNAAFNNN